jgi:NAD(P)H-hydrate epimerase
MNDLPAVTGPQMAAVDRAMVDVLGLDIRQIMETAGRQVAVFARRMLAADPRDKSVTVLCGTGGNGGDGMVAARYLHGWGADVRVALAREPNPDRHTAATHQLAVLRAIGVPVDESVDISGCDLIVDGLLGFSTTSPPTGTTAELIRIANMAAVPILSIDLPSGLQASSGEPFDPTIRATITLTLGLPKTGLLADAARPTVGDLWVADIGIPLAAYAATGITVGPLFAVDEFLVSGFQFPDPGNPPN